MHSIAPQLKAPYSTMDWRQKFINAIAPYNLTTSTLLSGKEYIPHLLRPKILYRYSKYERNYFEVACDNVLYLSEPNKVNDPYDLYANIDAIKILEWVGPLFDNRSPRDIITELNHGGLQTPYGHILQRFFNEIRKVCSLQPNCKDLDECINFGFKNNFKRVMRYASFSEVHDSSPMWAYYADGHKGYCLEYKVRDFACGPINFENENFYSALMPVVYTEIPFDGNSYLRNTKQPSKEIFEKIEKYAFILLVILCLQKISLWSHEKEWRLILSSKEEKIYIPENDSPVRLSAIHAGARMHDDQFNELRELAKRFNITFYRMGVDRETFQLCSERDSENLFPREYPCRHRSSTPIPNFLLLFPPS